MRVSVIVGLVVVGCVSFGLGCSSSKDDDEQKEEGALPCDQSAAECRAKFADTYQGSYTGDAAGSLILSADRVRAIVGTGHRARTVRSPSGSAQSSSASLTGEADDGTRFWPA